MDTRPQPDPDYARDVYLHLRTLWRGGRASVRRRFAERSGGSKPFSAGRDPKSLGDVLKIAAVEMGWNEEIEQARLLEEWDRFVGESIAPHTAVVGITYGVMQVQCDSTAWATELRRLRGQILTRLLEEYPDSGVTDLRFLSPGAPSWRHGPRTVRGRGPRDTYG